MDELVLLTDDEFDALSERDQEAYLDLLGAELDAPTPTPIQQKAMLLADEVDELLYGGAAGGAKSWLIRWRAQQLSRKYPGHHTLILRESFPELRRTHIRESVIDYSKIPKKERPTWKPSRMEWWFPNGSIIEFGHCATDDDVRTYLSAEYDAIFIDESSEFSEYRITMLRSRLRTKAKKAQMGVRPHLVMGSNPGGIGHKYHKDRYIVPTDYGDKIATIRDEYNGRVVERKVAFLPAKVTDNPHIDPAYIDNLISLPEALRRQYLEGDWDSFEGQYFPEFARDRDGAPWHVVRPFEIPSSWPRIRGMDFGHAAPFACVWIAFDHDGTAYVYREAYERHMTATEQARLVNQMSVIGVNGVTKPERIDYTVLDPACWSNHGGVSIAKQYADAGLYCRKADNQRIDGWVRVRDYLAEGSNNQPGLKVFSTCRNLIDELANAIHDRNKPEDLDTTLNDHALDALRYALMTRPRSYKPPKPPADMSIEARIDRLVKRKQRGRARLPEGLGMA